MAMRETTKSLRAYFILVGVLSLGGGVASLGQPVTVEPPQAVGALLAALFGLGFLVAGIRLPRLLAGSTLFIKVVIFGNVAYQLVRGAAGLASGAGALALIFPALYLLLSWYLIANVNRLARDPSEPPPASSQAALPDGARAPKSPLVPVGILMLLAGPILSPRLAAMAAAADRAGDPHILWLLTDAARATTLLGLACLLLGFVRNRRWRKERAARAA